MSNLKWKVKAIVQIVLSVMPYGTQVNHLFQKHVTKAFSPQNMLKSYRVQVKHVMAVHSRRSLSGARILEIGPGAYSIAGVLFWLLGAKKQYFVDLHYYFKLPLLLRYVQVLLGNSEEVARDLCISHSELCSKLKQLLECDSDEQYFDLSSITYFAPGDAQRTGLPENSVDLVYSYGVLEHIPALVLNGILAESRRILSTGGRHYHNIGLHDHFHNAGLGNGVNFLRYSEFQWKLIAGNRLAYHNRLRRSDYISLFGRYDAQITYSEDELLEVNKRELAKFEVDKKFSSYDKTDLAYSHLFIEFELPVAEMRNRAEAVGA